jgi:RNA-binding protein
MSIPTKKIIHFRSIAQTLKPMFQIGKDGLTPKVMTQINNYLFKHELGKIAVLESSPQGLAEISALLLAEQIQTIQQIGRNLVVFKSNPTLPKKDRAL